MTMNAWKFCGAGAVSPLRAAQRAGLAPAPPRPDVRLIAPPPHRLRMMSMRAPGTLLVCLRDRGARRLMARCGTVVTVHRHAAALILALAARPQRCVPRTELDDTVYGDDPAGGPTGGIYRTVSRARAAAEALGYRIVAVRGRGYVLEPRPSAQPQLAEAA